MMLPLTADGGAEGRPPTLQELRAARGGVGRSWTRRISFGLGASMVAAIIAWLVLPNWIRVRAEAELTDRLGRATTIERVGIHPFVWALTVEGLAVAGPEGGQPRCLSWSRLRLDLSPWALLTGTVGFDAIELDGFYARVERGPGGRFDYEDVMARLADASAVEEAADDAKPVNGARSLRLAVRRLEVTDARLDYADTGLARPYATSVGPLSFKLEHFRTSGEAASPYAFAAVTEAGEALSWRGTLSVLPARSDGELTMKGIDLARLSPYFHHLVEGELRSAKLDFSGRYTVALEEGGPVLGLKDGELALRDLRVGGPGREEDGLNLAKLGVSGIQLDLAAREFEAKRATISGLTVRAVRDQSGVDLARWLTPRGGGTEAAGPGPAFRVKIGEIDLSAVRGDWVDLTLPRRAAVGLQDARLLVRKFDSAEPMLPIAVEWSLVLVDSGRIDAAGTVALAPPELDFLVEVQPLALAPAAPYLEAKSGHWLAGGEIRLGGRVQWDERSGARFEGDLGLSSLSLRQSGSDAAELLRWAELAVTGVEAGDRPLRARVKEVRLSDAMASWKIGGASESAVPVADVVGQNVSQSRNAPPAITIERVVLERVGASMEDAGVVPSARVALTELSGTVTGLDASAPARADLDLRGLLDGVAPLVIRGRINPLAEQPFMDLTTELRGMDLLAAAGPYVGKYAGRTLDRGSLSATLRTKLVDQTLDAQNVVTLDRFELGARTNSPDATALPVGLALALLRDTQGRIVIDLPVKGRLDDPEFKIGRVVLRVVTNVLSKAATSPFSLLGAAFGGGGDELGWQDFAGGVSDPDSNGVEKLATVAKALRGRPALSLDLVPAYDPRLDGDALARQKLEQRLRAAAWQARREVDPNVPAPEVIEMSAELREGMIKRLYMAEYGGQGVAGVSSPPQSTTAQETSVEAALPPSPPESVSAQRASVTPGRLPRYSRREDLDPSPMSRLNRTVETTAKIPVTPPAPSEQVSAAVWPEASEMESRLFAAIVISEADLVALARLRGERLRRWLVDQGEVAPERVRMGLPQSGAARVSLELR